MKWIVSFVCLLWVFGLGRASAQVEQSSTVCSTPNLDSATAEALPYYDNNQVLEDYLEQSGYNDLEYLSFPSGPAARSFPTFLEPSLLIPLNLFIYRDGSNDPASAITEAEARRYVCIANATYREAHSAIQFYVNRVEFEANDFFNHEIATNLHVWDLWSRKRYIFDSSRGINVHFIRYNTGSEGVSAGKGSLPHYPVPPFANYSLYVRTHWSPSGAPRDEVSNGATLAHEIGHTLGLLHTHHPGRLASLIFNQENATISNGCYQEAVSRSRKNHFFDGCFARDGQLKCAINGDLLCDTEADPNQLLAPNQIDGTSSSCIYHHPPAGNFRADNWNAMWTPPTHNVMSYSAYACLNEFSRGQIAIMWMEASKLKNFIGYQAPKVSASSDTVCFGDSKEFTLSGDLPSDAIVTWSVEPANLVTVSSGTGRTATLSPADPEANGAVKLVFTLSDATSCYLARVSSTVEIGGPPTIRNITGPNWICPDPTLFFWYSADIEGASEVWWNIPGDTIAYDNILDSRTVGICFDSDPPVHYPGQTSGLSVVAFNQCGMTSRDLPIQHWCN